MNLDYDVLKECEFTGKGKPDDVLVKFLTPKLKLPDFQPPQLRL